MRNHRQCIFSNDIFFVVISSGQCDAFVHRRTPLDYAASQCSDVADILPVAAAGR